MNNRIRTIYQIMQTHPVSPYLLLGAITLLAAVLRLYKLGEWSFWIDEIYTIERAQMHYANPELILRNIPPARYWMPLSTILTAQAINLWGVSEWGTRFVSMMIGTITIPVLYFPMKKLLGVGVTLVALLLLALSPWHIFWSQNARFYTALMLFSTLALFAFYFAIERDRPAYLIAFYLLFYLGMSERMIAGFILPVAAAYLLLLWVLPIEKPPGFRWRNILIFSAPLILFLILQIYVFATRGAFIFGMDIEALPSAIDSPSRLLIVIAFSIGLPVLLMALFTGLDSALKKERAGLFFLTAALLPVILLALTSPFVFTVERYALITLVFWIGLAAAGVKTVFALAGKRGFLLALAVFAILLGDAAGENLMYYQINRGNRLDWREAAAYVQENKEPDAVIISTRWELANQYTGEEVIDYQTIQPEDLEQIHQPMWFIIDYPGIWHGSHESKTWMESHATIVWHTYLRTREQNSLVIYHYDPRLSTDP